MCMGGGGGGKATVVEPDYSRYDAMFNQQKAVIDAQMNGPIQGMQSQLDASLRKQQSLLTDNLSLQESLANNTQAQAQRLATLMGPPPPEKTATAPTTGKGRKAAGKSSLRIDQSTAASQAAGTGLNII